MEKRVAIIGFAFRLPGARDHALWDLLCAGRDLVTEVEDGRWAKASFTHPDRSEPGCSYTFAAGSIGDVRGFDAAFFGISPREAEQMDPQQRLLLELAWETFESGGIRPSSLRGSRTAVYLGFSGADYPYRRADDLASMDATAMTGSTGSVAANRLSYFFDLRGPSMAIDTACSSSLVAFHQAWLSLQAGESDLALVGGISLHLHPFPFVGFSKASMLSPRGICSVFDAAADGYVRSEGGGLFLIKPLDRALADGNRIFALALGSGVNCDGKTNGLTVPGMNTQAALLREIYERAGIAPAEVDYIEAHGTGTVVGDPIETRAIGEVFGQTRPAGTPVPIGSVKSNLGHLETAAGVAGLVKALYCLRHRAIPPTIHLETTNPNIRFEEWNLRVVTETTPLPANKPLIIGINSFGFGGANAHVVLASYEDPAPPETTDPIPECTPLLISSRTLAGLRATADAYRTFLRTHPAQSSEYAYYDVAYNAFFSREMLDHRAVIYAPDQESAIRALTAYAAGEPTRHLAEGTGLNDAARPVFVYTGNGAQWAGMGQTLLRESAVFRAAVDEIDRLFRQWSGQSLIDELMRLPGEDRLALTEIAQPTLFAIQVGITEVLREWGTMPAAVVGHSVGEVAAAWACGALPLEQAVHLIYERSSQQGTTRGAGMMTAVGLGADDAEALLRGLEESDRIAIAGINSPRGVTLAGVPEALATLEQTLAEREIFYRRLPLDYAFHSPAMDPIRRPLIERLGDLKPKPARIPFFSTVTGDKLGGDQLRADYWWRNVREPVQFEAAIRTLANRGYNVFVEIGPHALLRNYIRDCLQAEGVTGRAIPTVTRGDDHLDRVREAFFQLLIAGSPQDLKRIFPREGAWVDLPRYVWQRESYWLEPTVESYDLIGRALEHPLLGWRLKETAFAWENRLDIRLQTSYRDHGVGEAIVFPAAGFVEMALAAAQRWRPDEAHEIEELEIRAPLLLEETAARSVRLRLDERDGSVLIESRVRLAKEPWLTNVVGRLLHTPALPAPTALLELPKRAYDCSGSTHYESTGKVGLNYGPAFQPVMGVWREGETLIAAFRTPEAVVGELAHYHLHPVFLDGCFQLLVDHLADEIDGTEALAFVPVKVSRMTFDRVGATIAYARSQLVRRSPRSMVADFTLYDAQCQPVAQAEGVRFRAVRLRRSLMDHTGYLRYQLVALPLYPTAASLPPLDDLARVCAASLSDPARARERDRYYQEVEPLLDVLCSAFALRALRALVPEDQPVDADGLITGGQVAASQRTLLQRLISILAEDSVLEPAAAGWRWMPEVALPDPEDIWGSLLGDYPDYAAEFLMVGRVGMHLGDVLAGRIEGADLIPHPCRSATFSQYAGGSPTLRRINSVVAELVGETIRRLPAAGRLRILEIGSCGSRLSAQVLPTIDFRCCDYVLAAPDQAVIDLHEDLLEHFPAVETRVVELDQPANLLPSSTDQYDLILLTNGLAESRDPEGLLRTLRERLRPGGLLVAIEQQTSRWMDLVFGVGAGIPAELTGQPGLGRIPVSLLSELLTVTDYRDALTYRDHEGGHTGPYLVLAQGLSSHPKTTPAPADIPPQILVCLQDDWGYSAALAKILSAGLEGAGHRVVTVQSGGRLTERAGGYVVDPSSVEQLEMLVDTIRETYGTIDGIIHLQGLDPEPKESLEVVEFMERQVERCAKVTAIFQACERRGLTPRSWLVTSGAAPAPLPDDAKDRSTKDRPPLMDAPLWGFGRTLINEYIDFHVRLIDLAVPDQLERMAAGLLREILNGDAEDEVVLTGEGRFAARVYPLGRGNGDEPAERAAREARRVGLTFQMPGPLKHLTWREQLQDPSGPDEVEIAVHAAGLNFRDVMYAMGLLSDEAVEQGFAGPTLGMELSGTILRLGSEVTGLAVGDPVIAFAPASFATRAVTKAAAVVPKPPSWSFEAAATVPTTFFTAYYALHHLAHLQTGERILIHGAAGGVGIAAIQLSKYLGAEIFATAGSHEKRDFVRLLGADHVMDSRSLTFADEILRITDGTGVDVVLNSLAGEAINRNLKVLRPFGRFLELGKRDFYENTRIGLRPFRNNVSYFGIDADQLMAERPALTRRLFTELMALFESGILRPLPYRAFPASEAVEAFRYMQQSRQIGKVILTFRDPPLAQATTVRGGAALTLPADATYLVTGGLGGFGARTALWLAHKGARHLALLSRSGAASTEAVEMLAELARLGVDARPYACDVADAAALQDVMTCIQQEMPPLRGVVHAAAVYADGLIRNMDRAQIRQVFAPKIAGALHLDQLTRAIPLDFFILYSSATTLFGNPGQANYVGANRCLEAFAEMRRQDGRPALCVSWGAIEDAGYLARHREIKESLRARMGGAALTAEEALNILERLLLANRSGVCVLDLDWNALRRSLPAADSPRFLELSRLAEEVAADGDGLEEIQRWVAELSTEELTVLFIDLLKKEVGQILRLAPERIDEQRSVYDLGMDSLMGVELVAAVEARFGVHLPVMALSEGPTIARLVERIIKQLKTPGGPESTGTSLREQARIMARQHGEQIDEQLIEEVASSLREGEDGQYRRIIH